MGYNEKWMPRRKKPIKPAPQEDLSKDLWISPRFSLKGQNGDRAWDHRQIGNPGSARFLELADIALGMRKPEPRKKAPPGAAHVTSKPEPYTR
jgi:hypothetical protein